MSRSTELDVGEVRPTCTHVAQADESLRKSQEHFRFACAKDGQDADKAGLGRDDLDSETADESSSREGMTSSAALTARD